MNNTTINILSILMIFVLITFVSIHAMPCTVGAKGENFEMNFDQKYKSLTYKKWQKARLVRLKEKQTGLFLTYVYNTGWLRLMPNNSMNMNQYWLWSKDGALMQPDKKVCLDYIMNDQVPEVTICDDSPSQQFVLLRDGRLVNITELPYYTVHRKDFIAKQKMRCLGGRDTNRGYRIPIIDECSQVKSRWEIVNARAEDYVNAVEKSGYRDLATPETELRNYTGVDTNPYLLRSVYQNFYSTYPSRGYPTGQTYPLYNTAASAREMKGDYYMKGR